jgi:hypothetical protein
MGPENEQDAQLLAELTAKDSEGQAPEVKAEVTPEPGVDQEVKPEPKVFPEDYVRGLRAENARYRRELRETQARVNEITYGGQAPQVVPPSPIGVVQTPTGQVYDPRVDDLILDRKLDAIKADPYFAEVFNEVDDEGYSFKERLLMKAEELQWPIAEIDALAFKMEKDKIIGKAEQRGINKAYESMKTKAAAAPDRGVSSGKSVEDTNITSLDDAVKAAMKLHGVTDLSQLRQ